MELTGKQKRHLRGLAHHLDATVQLGGNGVTSALIEKTKTELELHELIKVKVGQGTMSAKDAGPILAEQAGAALVQTIGRTVVLYKRREKDPEIRLPKA